MLIRGVQTIGCGCIQWESWLSLLWENAVFLTLKDPKHKLCFAWTPLSLLSKSCPLTKTNLKSTECKTVCFCTLTCIQSNLECNSLLLFNLFFSMFKSSPETLPLIWATAEQIKLQAAAHCEDDERWHRGKLNSSYFQRAENTRVWSRSPHIMNYPPLVQCGKPLAALLSVW